MPQRQFTVILEPEEDGGYSVHCPALPGCSSQGDTREDALANIVEAILLVLDVLREKNTPIPAETPELVSEEIGEILKARSEDGLPLTVETAQVNLPSAITV
ncbi:MAG: type II toxin-antitoxin system HicB family antitoxin [Dehalococcoidia bacterium]